MLGFLSTLSAAFVVIVIAVLLLGIGWLLTGKSKLRGGMCGRTPTQTKGCGTDQTCGICGKQEPEDKKKE